MGIFWNVDSPDFEALREMGHLKRFMDLIMCDTAFRKKALADPLGAVQDANLQVSEEDARYYSRFPAPAPGGLLSVYYKEKRQHRAQIRQRAGNLRIKEFASWRQRQINRCDVELKPRVNSEFTHIPFVVELSAGCSVGCPFCGLGAKKLTRVCRADPQTMDLFTDLITGALELLGPGVREAVLYSATEPMDVREYPAFAQRFQEICGRTPITTTAVPLRDPEKTRKILAMDQGQDKTVHRFSLLSEEIFRRCAEVFTPEETLYVDFLPRYEESMIGLVRAGRGRKVEGWKDLMTDQGTISCVSGFVVNLAERTWRLTTPCRACDKWPNGEMTTTPEHFDTAPEALHGIENACRRMRMIPEKNLPLYLQPFLRVDKKEPFALENPQILRIIPDREEAAFCRILTDKPSTLQEIMQTLPCPQWKTQLTAVSLFQRGIITHGDGFDK